MEVASRRGAAILSCPRPMPPPSWVARSLCEAGGSADRSTASIISVVGKVHQNRLSITQWNSGALCWQGAWCFAPSLNLKKGRVLISMQ